MMVSSSVRRCAAPRLAPRGQQPVQGEHRGEVAAFFEQGRIGGARRLVYKALRVQHGQRFLLRVRAERERWSWARAGGGSDVTSAVPAGAAHARSSQARRTPTDPESDSTALMSWACTSRPGVSRPADWRLFGTSVISSACRNWARRVSFSRSSSAMRIRSALRSTGLRPRLLGARASRMPWARCARLLLRREEHNPSRRRSAPISPGARKTSTVFRIWRLYSAVNRRRLGFAAT